MEDRIGKYRLVGEIGRGSAGTVYRARDEFLDRDVALKVYPGDADGPAAARFVNEAALVGRLQHPHIVGILDAVAEPARRYVAMEYVDGGSLAGFTRPGSLLPAAEVIQIAFKCCSALDFASRAGVVHRAIEPSSILRDSAGEVRLGGFGSASVSGQAAATLDAEASAYLAPEQIAGAPATTQADMFSLGITVYELLTGVHPFRADDPEQTAQRILRATAVPPSLRNPELPALIDAVVGRLLRKRPEERYPSWAEAALELAHVGRMSVYARAVPDSEKHSALRTAALTRDFDDADLWNVVSHTRWRRVPPQQVLVTEGQPGNTLLLVASGSAKVLSQGRLLDMLHAGDCFGEMAYVQGAGGVRNATVQTSTECLVVEFDRNTLERLSPSTQLKMSNALVRVLAERLAQTSARVAAAPSPAQGELPG